MRAPRRLVLSGLVAAAAALGLEGLGAAALRVPRPGAEDASASRGERLQRQRRAEGRASSEGEERAETDPGRGSPVPGAARTDSGGSRVFARLGVAGATTSQSELRRRAEEPAPLVGSDPGPPVHLDPLRVTRGRVSAALEGHDPGAPRPLRLWRVRDGRAALVAEGASRDDGSLAFPELLLGTRDELLATGVDVSAELAARLVAERIAVPALGAGERAPEDADGTLLAKRLAPQHAGADPEAPDGPSMEEEVDR